MILTSCVRAGSNSESANADGRLGVDCIYSDSHRLVCMGQSPHSHSRKWRSCINRAGALSAGDV